MRSMKWSQAGVKGATWERSRAWREGSRAARGEESRGGGGLSRTGALVGLGDESLGPSPYVMNRLYIHTLVSCPCVATKSTCYNKIF